MSRPILERFIVNEIKRYLKTNDIIVLHGARQVGKTSLLQYLRKELKEKSAVTHYIDLENPFLVNILDGGVEQFLTYLANEGFDRKRFSEEKKLFVFIDEIQYLKNPSSFLKLIADHYREIKLIVSGSSAFDIRRKFKDSLVGRTVDFEIFNLSFKEFLFFRGYFFSPQKKITEKKLYELTTLFKEYILYGGYPKIALTSSIAMKEKYLQQIINTYIKKDIRDFALIKDVYKFNQLLGILASQSGQLLNVTELANTCGVTKQTIEHYLFLLEQTYIVQLVRPYSRNRRKELSKTPKIFFYDTGLMQLLWLKQLPKEVIGQVFETSIFSELIKKYGIASVNYWRTKDKKEIDFIVNHRGKLLPIEVKLNFAQYQASPIRYFSRKYKVKNYKVVALQGKKQNANFVYPWEL